MFCKYPESILELMLGLSLTRVKSLLPHGHPSLRSLPSECAM